MPQILPVLLIVLLLPLHLYSLASVTSLRKELPRRAATSLNLPPPIVRIVTLDFKGLVSDLLLLKTMVFYGSTLERTDRPRMQEREWRWMLDNIDLVTELDPYFFSPYHFSAAIFPWEGNLVKETNKLLQKGRQYRNWDWQPLFFLGFNEFYFLHNDAVASEYLMEGANRPEAPPLLATLATRLAYKANKTENAILFIQGILDITKDESTRKVLETRLKSLQGVLYLERGVQAFREKIGREPSDIQELLTEGFIVGIPRDYFGGQFYIDKDGSVKTTSDMYYLKK